MAQSRVFPTVLLALGIAGQTPGPAGPDGTRVTARAKGQVERPFHPVKEAYETLSHFPKPAPEAQATDWLLRYLLRSNAQPHRAQDPARLADGLAHLPPEGLRAMCTWEQCCRMAREPERRQGGVDVRVTGAGPASEGDPQLAGEAVLLLGGVFADALYGVDEGEHSGPYTPVSGPLPLHRYRAFTRGKRAERATVSSRGPISSRCRWRPGRSSPRSSGKHGCVALSSGGAGTTFGPHHQEKTMRGDVRQP